MKSRTTDGKLEIIVTVHGREMILSEQELVSILERHFAVETTRQETTTKTAQPPAEGKWFEVNPTSIRKWRFEFSRKDRAQEQTRRLILYAFDEMRKYPSRYSGKFKTMIPTMHWNGMATLGELREIACDLGDNNADLVEQALEWAQRIENGETWEAVCNNPDQATHRRSIIGDNGYARIVGGGKKHFAPASKVDSRDFAFNYRGFDDVVPLVVSYD